ncbi:MAG: DegV family protein [Gracilibacteraceae bacterium]|jgi:DegV family protein with EDD domain|nr:DegV family protein [Gracilibacteraceae bacterium]
MSVKIVADSSCDLNEDLKKKLGIKLVPLTLEICGNVYRDDENLDVKGMIKEMTACQTPPRTACPSPNEFIKAYEGEDSVFVVTLSSSLSGTYESAMLAKKMFLETAGNKFIHVFDSLSASIGETLISIKIFELVKKKCSNLQIVEKVNEYIKGMKTFFLLESLDNLIKNGRMSRVKGGIATLLNIKPVMGATDDGHIKLVESVRGYKRAFMRFVDIIGEQGEKLEDKVIGIAHVNCHERAEEFKNELMKKYKFKDIIVVETAGLTSVYANQGGLIVAF